MPKIALDVEDATLKNKAVILGYPHDQAVTIQQIVDTLQRKRSLVFSIAHRYRQKS